MSLRGRIYWKWRAFLCWIGMHTEVEIIERRHGPLTLQCAYCNWHKVYE